MPRIALITTSYPTSPGDPSGHFVATEARLLARSAEVHVVAPAAEHDGASTEGDGGLTVHRIDGGGAFGWPGVAARVRDRPSRLVAVGRWGMNARARLRSLGPFDRVVAHWAVPCAYPVACGLGAPFDIVSHGGDVRALTRLPPPLARFVVARLLAGATTWRFVSTSLRDALAATLPPDQVARLASVAHVEPATIDLPDASVRSAELRRHHGTGGRPLRVMVGRLVPGKRFDRALEALAAEDGAKGRVVIVGDGPERGRLEAQGRALGLDVTFVGMTAREEALAWIGAADALVHASHAEGLSTVLREAAALGVPVHLVP